MDVKNLLGYNPGYIPGYMFISEFPGCSQKVSYTFVSMDMNNLLGYNPGYVPGYLFISEFPERCQVRTLSVTAGKLSLMSNTSQCYLHIHAHIKTHCPEVL